VPALADLQARVRRAVVDGDGASIASFLAGAPSPSRRLAIYQRHYDASLVTQLLGRFPTVVWLAGSGFVTDAARAFIRAHPPAAPCLAEYGEDFPGFLAGLPGAGRVPYLRSVGEVDWRLGEVAVAIDRPSAEISTLAGFTPEALLELRLLLQPGLRHIEAGWPVDELVKLHLADRAPDRLEFEPADVNLEIRGARGAFRIGRLNRGVFVFRRAVAQGSALGAAVEAAEAGDPGFDPAPALTSLFAEGLVTGVAT
jgi:hypothetical protein